ncbi:MAG: class I SAM-dependent methyltransferase [Terricaulis sp.]
MKPRNSPIQDECVGALLDKLHSQAERQLPGVVAHIAKRAFSSLFSQKPLGEDLGYYRDKLIPIDRNQGALIYLLCRSLQAKRVVEYGTSFGVSTLYLACAVRDNGGGRVVGTELEPEKIKRARANFDVAGLSALVDLREGDALKTLVDCGGPVDFLLVDGWPRLALSVLKLVSPQLRAGAIVICDESGHAPADRKAYRDFVRAPSNGFVSGNLPLFGGTEISVKS